MNLTAPLIEAALLRIIESEDFTKERFTNYASRYGGILSLVFSEDLDFLNPEEKQAMMFITDVLLMAHQDAIITKAIQDVNEAEDRFEKLLERWENLPGDFEERIASLYEMVNEKEAVSLVEEVLEEIESISKEGKEAIYLTAYAMIEMLS